MYLCNVERQMNFQGTNVSHKTINKMNNYVDFQLACNKLASEITDISNCNFTVVFHLILTAASCDFDFIIESCCKNLDRITGCGYDFIYNNVVSLYRQFE